MESESVDAANAKNKTMKFLFLTMYHLKNLKLKIPIIALAEIE